MDYKNAGFTEQIKRLREMCANEFGYTPGLKESKDLIDSIRGQRKAKDREELVNLLKNTSLNMDMVLLVCEEVYGFKLERRW